MREYIDRELDMQAVDCVNLQNGIVEALKENIKDVPAADVRPVVRAMWNEQLNIAETVTEYIRNSNWLNTRDKRTLAQLRSEAVCVESPIGEYRCHVKIYFSPQSERKPICVDTCLQHEIHELIYKHNVNTIGSCCGHGRKQAFIQVSPQSVQKMHALGYEALTERIDKEGNIIGRWCFKPKTYFLDIPEWMEGE